jgi:hypothetical protein
MKSTLMSCLQRESLAFWSPGLFPSGRKI